MAWKIPDGLNFLWLYVVIFRITESMKITLRSHHRVALTLMTVMGLTFAAVAEEGWLVDFAKAKVQSAKDGKPILMEFTGVGLVSAQQGAP